MGTCRQIALLRGLNVGSAKRVAMADLRKLLTDLGFRGVNTVLNSGNVVYDCPEQGQPGPAEAAALIEEALVLKLGVAARVTVLDAEQLAHVVEDNSLEPVADDPTRLLVAVLSDPSDRERLAPLAHQRWEPEAMAVGRWAAYLWCADGVLASRAAAAMGTLLGDAVTTRNWNIIRKLHALACERPA
ncbi:DUF1697 domain-containing protein [Pseudoduganella namucuonensis]|uniref:Uncharacterized conserved protein, DUF1697 family n=1 Tax=Pseudoduganella namucuonensis TaxID=1035707 RepID=A0A1I7LJK3_9BURK|nr:DUF1697 domain-containing protein [Pseudoduganella namucuonensis]SFV09867.1 Uncharacterized conserved protein, DUF1697 family [Pseudoduganella namucuonensis]